MIKYCKPIRINKNELLYFLLHLHLASLKSALMKKMLPESFWEKKPNQALLINSTNLKVDDFIQWMSKIASVHHWSYYKQDKESWEYCIRKGVVLIKPLVFIVSIASMHGQRIKVTIRYLLKACLLILELNSWVSGSFMEVLDLCSPEKKIIQSLYAKVFYPTETLYCAQQCTM